MKAITFDTFGGPEVLTISDLPDPGAKDGEVVVRIAATTVNPTDIMMRNGAQAKMMEGLKPPFIVGMEFSGTIADPGTSGFETGQPVIGVLNPRTPRGGSAAELVPVSARSVAALSPDVDLVAASTVPMNALTAAMSLDFLDLEPGRTVLVTGGGGMLGACAIQLAKDAGLVVLANVGDKDRALMQELRVDHILPRDEGLEDAIKAIAPNGIDGLIDGALIAKGLSHLVRDGGGIVSLRSSYVIEDPRLRIHNVAVLKGMEDTETLERIASLIGSGALRTRVADRLPASEARAAHERTEVGGLDGRIVLTF